MIVDTSGLIAAFGADQHRHAECAAVLREGPSRVVSPFVLAELDYLAMTRRGVEAELRLLDELSGGAYEIATFGVDDMKLAVEVIGRYRDLGLGLADASLVVLADRYRTNTILTLDERHFRTVRPLTGGTFRLLPADLP
jgi:predicted nucleic acid-binding protein